jgi:hypothetical protein
VTTRVFLHVGLHKTGTTYLQSLLRQNHRSLRHRQGVYVPPGARQTLFASLDLIPWDRALARDPRVPGAWERLAAEVNQCGLPTAVVSEERLDVANRRQARHAVASFDTDDVHVVVTVRDLARVSVSAWQESVKNGSSWTLDDFLAKLADPSAAAAPPARAFWLHEDVTGVLRTWSSVVPPANVHVVTVPAAGATPDLLARRFGSVVGFTPEDLPKPAKWTNENTGAVGTELLRRLNERLGGSIDNSIYKRAVATPVGRRLAAMPDRGTPELDDIQWKWAAESSARFAEEIAGAGYQVVGDLADLQPEPRRADGPFHRTAPTDTALLDAALDALVELAGRHSKAVARTSRETAAGRQELSGRLPRARTHLRSRAFAATRRLADLAGRTPAGRYAGAAYLRRRAGR